MWSAENHLHGKNCIILGDWNILNNLFLYYILHF